MAPTLEDILRRLYPHPDDDKYVRVRIEDDHCQECGRGAYAFREDNGRYHAYGASFFEVPKEWLVRWNRLEAGSDDDMDELQNELESILYLPPGQDRINPASKREAV